jgi:Tfp pilus assembly protein PilF
MRRIILILLTVGFAVLGTACGGTEASEKSVRKSQRFYEAASISWFDEKNVLAAIRNLVRAIETDPKNDEAHYLLGIIRLGRGELDEAEKHLRETVRLRKDRDPAGHAGALNNLGVLLIHQKRYEEAAAVLKQSAEEVMNREPWLAFGNLGWAYIELGRYDEAIEVLRRSVFDQPKYCVGLFRMGQAYYKKKDYEAAVVSLKESVGMAEEGCGQMQEAHQLLGMAYLRQEKPDEARAALEQCTALSPVSPVGIECAKALEGL